MAAESKVPVRQEKLAPSSTLQAWQPFEGLRQEIDRLFDDIGWGVAAVQAVAFRRRASVPARPDTSDHARGRHC